MYLAEHFLKCTAHLFPHGEDQYGIGTRQGIVENAVRIGVVKNVTADSLTVFFLKVSQRNGRDGAGTENLDMASRGLQQFLVIDGFAEVLH